MLVLPATPEVIAVVHRRGGGRARRAVHHRQHHARAAAAVPARRSTTAGSSSWPCWPTPARSRPASAPSRRSGRSPRRSPTWSGRCPTPRSTAPASPRPPGRAVARSLFVDAVDRGAAEAIVEHLEASTRADGRGAAPGARRGDGPRARRRHRVRPPRAPRSWSPSPRSTSVPRSSRCTRPGSPASRRRCARASRGAYVNFLGDEGEARVREAYPGATWDRLAAIKAALRPGQPLPAQPEHPARIAEHAASTGRLAARCPRSPHTRFRSHRQVCRQHEAAWRTCSIKGRDSRDS